MTVSEVLEQAPDRDKWSSSFNGYRAGWNDSWRYVERFGCMPIPPMYKELSMELKTPISFSMPSDKDEGICPLMRGRELQRSTQRQSVVSSKFFSRAHSIVYDLDGAPALRLFQRSFALIACRRFPAFR